MSLLSVPVENISSMQEDSGATGYCIPKRTQGFSPPRYEGEGEGVGRGWAESGGEVQSRHDYTCVHSPKVVE